jgi:hypothetical protein
MLSRVAQRSIRSSIVRDHYRECRRRFTDPYARGPRIPDFPRRQSYISVRSIVLRGHLSKNETFVRNFSSQPLKYEETTMEKSVEEQYSKKTPIEHVLLRPGMYVGPIERLPPNDCWVLDPTPKGYTFSPHQGNEDIKSAKGSYRMAHKEYGLIPALIKIFDEILVNASDNRLRHPKTCTLLDVRIDPGGPDRDPCIRIWNNGKGIPIQIHKEEGMYGEFHATN